MASDRRMTNQQTAGPPKGAHAGELGRARWGRSLVQRILGWREFNILVALIVLGAVLSFASEHFLTRNNLFGVMRAFSLTAIMAIGETMVIITDGIDLSVGSIMGLAGLVTGMVMAGGQSAVLAVMIGILVGATMGLVNGGLITGLRLPPFIATLGMLSIGRGLVYVITKGYPVTVDDSNAGFLFLGQGYIGPVPVPVVLMLLLTVAGAVFLTRTSLGRYVYALGGNEQAARLSGIRVDRVKLLIYTLSGLFAGIAGVVLLARLVSAQPSAGLGYELPVIAAAVIGGTSLSGGEGSIVGTVIGAALIGILENGMVLVGINTYAQQAVTGLVILLAVAMDMWRKRRR
ncbi:MAG TPA: ABC transporter permease [Symbiobacteriaceae bacterium]|jgi:ribose transport system permease protein